MILVVSYPGEDHTDGVVARLQAAGRDVVRIDLADFPAVRSIEAHWSHDEAGRFLIDHDEGTSTNLAAARVVWWRRVRSFVPDPAIGDAALRTFAHSETSQALLGILDSLKCPWVNPRLADEAAHHKPYQWSVAHALGLKVPRTLVTTRPEAARAFVRGLTPSRVVYKPFLASIEDWRETRLVRPEDLERIDLVRLAPVIFQQYVQGVDLRITVVGDRVFAAAIDARRTDYPVDMRMVIGQGCISVVELPEAIARRLLALQRRLGLVYGAIDMRLGDDGEYYFLEVNPAGQWRFVEERTELAITQALVDLLSALADRGSASRKEIASSQAHAVSPVTPSVQPRRRAAPRRA